MSVIIVAVPWRQGLQFIITPADYQQVARASVPDDLQTG
jgi:hypothetical protein